MDALEAKPLLIIIIFIIPLIFLFVLSRFRRRRYPPGPRGWPVIGNMGLMDKLIHRGLAQLAEQYGGIFHLRMGVVPMVVVSGPDTARQVLQAHDHTFSNRPATIAINYLTYDRVDMVFAHYGPFWRQMRKLFVTKLFSRKRAESWGSIRAEVDGMVRAVAINAGSAMNIGELAFGMTLNIIYRAAFGSGPCEGRAEFIEIMMEFSKLFGAFNVSDFIPWLRWMDPQGLNSRLIDARAALDGFIDGIIDDHMRKRKPENGPDGPVIDTDMVDELLAFYTSDGETEVSESHEDLRKSSIRLTRNNIKAIIMDIMFGGTETIASVLEWVMAELLKSPRDLKKAQQELTNVVGPGRKVEEPDLDKLTHLKCCLKEVLRLHAPIPLLIHESAENAVVSGYHIPAKTRVVINVWAIGRDKSVWDDADSFKPERFSTDGSPDFKGIDFEFIPFGSGRRSCPGMQLSLYALEMVVAHLLHCFNWELPDGMKPSELDMNDVEMTTGPVQPEPNRVVNGRLTVDHGSRFEPDRESYFHGSVSVPSKSEP